MASRRWRLRFSRPYASVAGVFSVSGTITATATVAMGNIAAIHHLRQSANGAPDTSLGRSPRYTCRHNTRAEGPTYMTIARPQFLWSSLLGTAGFAAVIAIGSIEKLDSITLLLAPGYFLAATIFQEGIHSDHAMLFLVLAGMIDWVLFVLLALFLGRMKHKSQPS